MITPSPDSGCRRTGEAAQAVRFQPFVLIGYLHETENLTTCRVRQVLQRMGLRGADPRPRRGVVTLSTHRPQDSDKIVRLWLKRNVTGSSLTAKCACSLYGEHFTTSDYASKQTPPCPHGQWRCVRSR